MVAITETLYKHYNKRKEELEEYISAHNNASSDAAKRGIVFVILGVLSTLIPLLYKQIFDCNCMNAYYYSLAFGALVIIAGIVNFSISGKRAQRADYYRSEVIVLRDLLLSVQICESIDPANGKKRTTTTPGGSATEETEDISRITKTKELIIQQILNRCGR